MSKSAKHLERYYYCLNFNSVKKENVCKSFFILSISHAHVCEALKAYVSKKQM